MNDIEKTGLKLVDLIEPGELAEINEQFARTFNVASAIVDPEGNYLIEPVNICPVCRLIRKTEKGMAACRGSEAYMATRASEIDKPEIVPCKSIGFATAVAPIYVAGRHIATWLVSQFNPLDISPEEIECFAEKIGVDKKELLRSVSDLEKCEAPGFKEGVKLLWIFADKLSRLAYAGYRLKREIEERNLAAGAEKFNRYLQQAINSILDPIFIKDRDCRWIFLNDAFCLFMGYSRQELIGKTDSDFFPKEEADVFREKDEEVFSKGGININEEEFTSADGVTHSIVTKKSKFTGADGEEILVGTIHDITERKKMEKELQR